MTSFCARVALFGIGCLSFTILSAQEPTLPEGLGGSDSSEETTSDKQQDQASGKKKSEDSSPPLPEGLGDAEPAAELSTQDSEKSSPLDSWFSGIHFRGFAESRFGHRVHNAPRLDQTSLAEQRLKMSLSGQIKSVSFRVSADALYDHVAESHRIDLVRGQGWLDLREFSALLRPLDKLDLKIGRQVITWGTGDLQFLNDLFPKDWVSFFIGRDEDYLKAPQDAARATLFFDAANIDMVYTPAFRPDRFIDGHRIYSPMIAEAPGGPYLKTDMAHGPEYALRIYRSFGSWEPTLYFYRGYWKSPNGFRGNNEVFFPELSAYGASIRGPGLGGIVNAEISLYDSRDDSDGTDPFVPNSEFRALLGLDREISSNFNVGVQWYLERMLDYDEYRDNLPAGTEPEDRNRHVLTLRLTRTLLMDTLNMSLFTFYSPTDDDAYVRGNVAYDWDDNWTVTAGFNYFDGNSRETFFGQFYRNSNIYVSLRCGF